MQTLASSFFPETGLCRLKTVPVRNTKHHTKEQGTREAVSPSGSHSIAVISIIKTLASPLCLLSHFHWLRTWRENSFNSFKIKVFI